MAIPLNILKGKTVVVIDDDEASLHIAQLVLTHFGAIILTARNGQAGLDIIKAKIPDIVITDLSMPIMDGWKLLVKMREDPQLALIPTVALTAHAMAGDRDKALAAGFTSYMTKPFTPANLMNNFLKILVTLPTWGIKVDAEGNYFTQ